MRASLVNGTVAFKHAEHSQRLNEELVCNISKSGKLIEMGYDPLTKAPESKSMAVQTQGSWSSMRTVQDDSVKLPGGATLKMDQLRSAPAAQVLRLVVGLLGFEVHEKPNSWAEAWLTFQDLTQSQLGLGKPPSDAGSTPGTSNEIRGPSAYEKEQNRWQLRVLQHLKEHVELRELKVAAAAGATGGAAATATTGALAIPRHGEQGSIFGPDFQEHLELAEFTLKRITHAVSVLQSPEKDDRPMILREYSEEMILEVCTDLRQWLDQLATLLSLYHVHLLDLEAERRRLAATLEERQSQFELGEAERKNAVLRHACVQEMFNEEKMKRRAEALLGIQLQGEDAKIYSQKDLEEIQKDWEKEQLEPLLADIRELRLKKDELLSKLLDQKERRPVRQLQIHDPEPVETSSGGMPRAQMAMLCAAINATNERVLEDGLSGALSNLVEAVKTGSELNAIVSEINRCPIPEKPASPTAAESGANLDDMMGAASRIQSASVSTPADIAQAKCLASIAEEFNNLEARLRQCPISAGADKLSVLAAWSRDSVNLVRNSMNSKEAQPIRFLPPPKWDLGALNKKAGNIRTVGVNTDSDLFAGQGSANGEEIRKALEKDFQKRLLSMQQEFETELHAAKQAAERERLNAEEALARLATESERADATLADLRRKLMHMEKYMESKGHGQLAQDAIHSAGLQSFTSDKNVFVRLYRDAMDRMRRMAEAQARFFEEASTQFLRTVGTIIDPHLRFPGMDIESVMSPDQQRMMVYRAGRLSNNSSARSASPRPGQKEVWQGNGAPNRMGYHATVKGYQILATEEVSPRRSPPLSPTGGDLATRAAQARQLRPVLSVSEMDAEELGVGLSISATSLTHDRLREAEKLGSLEDPVAKALREKATTAAMQSAASVVPTRSAKPFPGSQKPGTASEHSLPPLDIRGHGRGGYPNPLHPGSGGRARGPPSTVLTGSPARDILHEHAHQVNLLDDKQPLLAIGSLKTSASTSLLMPGDPRDARAMQAVRTRHTATPQRLARSGASVSMPALEVRPPRLLVQSVGGF